MSKPVPSSQPQTSLNVLISGAGIAGPPVAYFLARAGHRCTIIERASELRASGQSVDVRGHGITVVQRMGIENNVRALKSREAGFRIMDESNQVVAEFPAGGEVSFTAEIEILRGELAIVLFEAAKNQQGVETIFGNSISAIQETDHGVQVKLKGGWPGSGSAEEARSFDLVVGADGWSSKTRTLAFGEAAEKVMKPLGQWTCWFTVPYQDTDTDWALWYNATRGRVITVRPDDDKHTRICLSTMTRDPKIEKELPQIVKAPPTEQKECFNRIFADAGWQADRLLAGMKDADDFYLQQIAQIHMDSWSKGRTVLVGDAASCPSPISGMGTTLALVGAYVLAGEIIRNPSDVPTAFKTYEDKMRPLVQVGQKLVPGAPGIANPETEWGIWVFQLILGFVSWTKIYKLFGLFGTNFNPPASAMELPDYNI